MIEEFGHNLVDEGLDGEDSAGGVVFGDGPFPLVMLIYIGLAEEVEDDLTADDGAVVMVEVGLAGQHPRICHVQ